MRTKILLSGMLLAVVASCALLDQWGSMTPKQKAIWMMEVYVAEYARYKADVVGELTEDQRWLLRVRWELLNQLYPLIQRYTKHSKQGTEPELELETLILNLLGRLGAEVGAPATLRV